MTFEKWITDVARAGDNPRGDFIRDTRELIKDGRIYDGQITCLLGLLSMMRIVSLGTACCQALDEAERCWTQYERINR